MNDLINDLGETVKEYSFPLILQFPHRIHAFYVTDETDYKPSVTHKVLPLHNLTILLQGRGHRRENLAPSSSLEKRRESPNPPPPLMTLPAVSTLFGELILGVTSLCLSFFFLSFIFFLFYEPRTLIGRCVHPLSPLQAEKGSGKWGVLS